MLLSDVGTFAVLALLLTLLPGLDSAMVLRSAITGGRRAGVLTGLGICTGALIWGACAAAGVSALLTASHAAYTGLRVAGALYMLWLGARILLRVIGREQPRTDDPGAVPRTGRRAFQRGLMTNLLNPKIGAFYVALLPQFIPPGSPHLLVGLLLAGVHDAESLVWFALLIYGAHSVRAVLRRPAGQRIIDGLTGTALIGFGVKLGLARR